MGNRQLFDEKSALELLEEFRHSGSNEPFEEIVRRYAAMVFGVCLRVTGDKHDAEDATQAVFLSLALQAKTSRQITYVGPWLQKVAHRLALDTKKSKTRRKRREEKLADAQRHASGNGRISIGGGAFGGGNGHMLNPADKPATEELKAIMMEELNQLPAKYRMPLVMHYFGGLSREEMSEQLRCNPSTLGVRVHRGKAMLGTRLAKRGIAISAVVLAVMLEHVVRESAVSPIISSATAASSGLVAGSPMGVAIASAKVAQIVRSTCRAMVYAKMRYAVVALLIISSAAFATGSGVVQQIKAHLPSINLTGWIKPLFRSIIPNLQASNTSNQDALAPLDHTVAAPDPKLTIDVDHIAEPRVTINPAPAHASQPIVSAPHVVAVAPVAKAPEPELNDVARAILNPPLYVNAARKPAGVTSSSLSISATSDSAKTESTSHDANETVAASSGDTFSLGAGGGGGFGKADVYVMPAGASLRNQTMIVGDAAGGFGVFRQLGGVNKIDGSLIVGHEQGSKGVYQLDGGQLLAQREVIGDGGEGAFIQTQGVNVADNVIIVGNAGHGTYQQDGGTTIVRATSASTNASWSAADATGDLSGLVLGAKPGSQGHYLLAAGSLDATPQIVAASGTGSIVQSGGTNSTGSLQIATRPDSNGSYTLTDGKLIFHPQTAMDSSNDVAISVGGRGSGTFTFGNDKQTGAIYQVGQYGASVVVRGVPTAEGAVRGYGRFNLDGALINNGQMIADGYRHDRTLDLSSFKSVTSTIENPAWGGTNGWFARRRGELKLPSIPVDPGTNTYTWGEDPGDPMLDLVNSVRFKVENAKDAGNVSIALLSAIRTDIPTLPHGHHFIGVWSFDGSDLGGFDAVDLQVRYDDAAAAAMGLDENILKLWEYTPSDGSWHRIMDDTFSRDTLDHIIGGRAPGELTYFAVSAPEPTSLMLVGIGASALILRRRRK